MLAFGFERRLRRRRRPVIATVGHTRVVTAAVRLEWRRYESFTEARRHFGHSPCVYVQADRDGGAIRVGKASKGLHARYRGGTGWALEAAMHGSGNVVFVAAVDADVLDAVESTLIWAHRSSLRYNQIGRRMPPRLLVDLHHGGDVPVLLAD